MSILFISHKLDEIRALCDRATILRGGRVTGDVDPRQHDSHGLARMMIGRDMPAPLHLAPMPRARCGWNWQRWTTLPTTPSASA